MRGRILATVGTVAAALALTPAVAHAATATLNNDAGTAVALSTSSALTIHTVAIVLSASVPSGEAKAFQLAVGSPDGDTTPVCACTSAGHTLKFAFTYAGNGPYKLVLQQ